MLIVEIRRRGDEAVSDQLDEMREWLEAEAIEATELHAVRVMAGTVTFAATFASEAQADRFIRRFGELGWRKV